MLLSRKLRRTTTLALAVLAVTLIGSAPPGPVPLPQFTDDPVFLQPDDLLRFDEDAPDCVQLVPHRDPSVSGVTDNAGVIELDVRVLIDTAETLGVAIALRDAETAAQRAAARQRFDALVARHAPTVRPGDQAYRAIDIRYDLSWGLYRPFEADGSPRNRRTAGARDAQTLIDGAKAQFGGKRPALVDAVYVLTDQDISSGDVGNGVVGQADCVGGIEWAERAFAVGEILPAIPVAGVRFYRQGTAKVMAHELGHLLGAHHHYQSCGPHAVAEASAGGVGACSLMTNLVDLTTLEFSPLNGAIIRGYAIAHAR